jgi:hypothetical protein
MVGDDLDASLRENKEGVAGCVHPDVLGRGRTLDVSLTNIKFPFPPQ